MRVLDSADAEARQVGAVAVSRWEQYGPDGLPFGAMWYAVPPGPYLGADVAARAARLRGERVLAVAALDVHQNFVPVRARQLGIAAGELVESSRERILAAYRRAGIGWDAFLDPTGDAAYAPRRR